MIGIHESLSMKWAAFDPIVALLVFLAYGVIDALYAKWKHEITRLDALRAATTGGVMHVLLAFGVVSYTDNYLYVAPLVLGSFIGTYLYVARVRDKKNAEG